MSDRIEQLIDVIREVKEIYDTNVSRDSIKKVRTEAVQRVANRRKILETTVSDKYRRQLNPPVKNTEDFDRLLDAWLQSGSDELRNVLIVYSVNDTDQRLIESFFKAEHEKPNAEFKVSNRTPSKAAPAVEIVKANKKRP